MLRTRKQKIQWLVTDSIELAVDLLWTWCVCWTLNIFIIVLIPQLSFEVSTYSYQPHRPSSIQQLFTTVCNLLAGRVYLNQTNIDFVSLKFLCMRFFICFQQNRSILMSFVLSRFLFYLIRRQFEQFRCG